MALRQSELMTNAAADIKVAETGKFRAMAGIALVVINNHAWVAPSDKWPQDKLRKTLEAFATTHGGMPLTTWQAYAKGIDTIAVKMADNLTGEAVVMGEDDEVDFDGIRDLSEVDAVSALVRIFTAFGVSSGGQIRDWAKQDGFGVFDADLVKRQRKEAAATKKAAEMAGDVAALMGVVGRDSASLPLPTPNQDLVAVTGLPAVLAALAALTGAERLEALTALNTMLEADTAAVATIEAVEETAPPMLPDHVEDEVTTPNKPRRARAVRAAKLAA